MQVPLSRPSSKKAAWSKHGCDALYVATVRKQNCRLVTADTRLIRKIGATSDGKLLIGLGEATA